MKNYKLVIFTLLLGLFASSSLFAQYGRPNDEIKHNFIKMSPLYFATSIFQLGYERLVGYDKGLLFFASVKYLENGHETKEGYGGEFQFKYYIFNKKLSKNYHRLYFSPYFNYKYTEIELEKYSNVYPPVHNDEYVTNFYTSYSIGVLFGYSLITISHLNIDVYLGGAMRRSTEDIYTNDTYDTYDDLFDPGYKGIAPKVGFDIGFNF